MLSFLLCLTPTLQDAVAPPAEIVPRSWLVIDAVDGRGRRPFRPDAVFQRHLLERSAPPPTAGEELEGERGRRAWRGFEAGADGTVRASGWAWTRVEAPADGVWMAELSGASTLFVDGAGFVGDVYRYGHRGVPVPLRAEGSSIFVTGIRGAFRLRLWRPEHRLVFAGWNVRLPDLVAGEPVAGEASVGVMNASLERVPLVYAVAGGTGPFARKRSLVTWGLEPLHLARVPLTLAPRPEVAPPAAPGKVPLYVSLGGHPAEDPHVHWLDLEVRAPHEARRRTYRSRVDGAVVEYSVLPPAGDGPADGLILSLHGAGVASRGQAASYAPKQGWWLAAPTNRAPFGFDWQDWGRIDAQEVMERMIREHGLDRRRVVVTGHSMGGHGTWSLAVNDPDAFAALAPSAGWCSFDTYGGRPDGRLRELWHGADGGSDTLGLLSNLRGKPIYILHGDADDNVPVSEARRMAAALDELGIDYQIHFEAGAGHWWTDDRYPGAECMDWPPIFALFADARLPELPDELDFLAADPGLDSRHFWLVLEQPLRYGRKLHVRAVFDRERQRVEVETDNVRRLRIDRPHRRAVLDGQELTPAGPAPAASWYVRGGDGSWRPVGGGLDAAEKGPHRSGPFKRAFDRDFVLVYATGGGPAENRESLERARYDAAVWFYRAFGNARLAADRELLDPDHPEDFRGRNLILYGNADTNLAWREVLPAGCPIEVERGRIRLGGEEWRGEDLAAVFVQPRRDDPYALVGAFAATGPAGARLGYTLAPFVSGVGYPDYAVFSAQVLAAGDGGVLAAGWWDRRWGRPPAGAGEGLQSPVR
ncbi:MAG: hypothetical protein D6702_07270 [Planctomycetota bacterium]|nr:MAG: hypothetical protein D6702_07270 [Planctomycetota bacterium]